MIRVVAKFDLKPGELDKAMELSRELIASTRKEVGCGHYDLAASPDNPNLLVILEAWESQAALDAHSVTEHFTRLVPQLAALCVSAPAVDCYEQLI